MFEVESSFKPFPPLSPERCFRERLSQQYIEDKIKQEGYLTCSFVISYHGGAFHGFQQQKNGVSVQAVIETALEIVFKEPIPVFVAGRTDAGVHALHQVIHAHLPPYMSGRKRRLTADNLAQVVTSLNALTRPYPVCFLASSLESSSFHARFSCCRRSYLYRILNRPARPVLEEGLVWHVRRPLSIQALQEGAQHLIGTLDFSSFRASGCQAKSPVGTIRQFEVRSVGEEIHFRVLGDSFLYRQVRNMVGTLKEMADSRQNPSVMKVVLEAKSRAAAGTTAPAAGLFFDRAFYD